MSDFVLVHGTWHGAWCWREVAVILESRGNRVFAPCLAGVGERASEPGRNIRLYDHIDDVVQVFVQEDLREVTLVGHSYGGMVITGAADKCRDRIAQLVYLDAFVPASGQSLRDILGADMTLPILEMAHSLNGGTHLPVLLPPAAMVNFEGDALDAFMERLTPHPLMTYLEPVILSQPPHEQRSFIFCSKSGLDLFTANADRAKEDLSWQYFEAEAPHDLMLSDPSALAALLEEIANKRAGHAVFARMTP